MLERTGISIVSEVISCFQDAESDLYLADLEDESKESENNKEGSLRESWVALNDFSIPLPAARLNLLTHIIHDCKYYDIFCPSVPTPPPNGLV